MHVRMQDCAGTRECEPAGEGTDTHTGRCSHLELLHHPGWQLGTASARDLPENAQGTCRTPLTQPSPFSTAATLTQRSSQPKKLRDAGSEHPHGPQSSSMPERGTAGRTHVQTQHFAVWFSPAVSPSHTLTLCILLCHCTAEPCLHSLCPLGCLTSPFTLLSSSFGDSHFITHSHSPKPPVQSPPCPIHAATCKSAEIPKHTHTPCAVTPSPGPHCPRGTLDCVTQDCSADKTCSFVSSSPNHLLSQAAGLAATSGRVWASKAKQCPAKKPFQPSWVSELYVLPLTSPITPHHGVTPKLTP